MAHQTCIAPNSACCRPPRQVRSDRGNIWHYEQHACQRTAPLSAASPRETRTQ